MSLLIDAIKTAKEAKDQMIDEIENCFYNDILGMEMETPTIFNDTFLQFEVNGECRYLDSYTHVYPSELMERFYASIRTAYNYAVDVHYFLDKQKFPEREYKATTLYKYECVAKIRAKELDELIDTPIGNTELMTFDISSKIYFLANVLRTSILVFEAEVKTILSEYEKLSDEDKKLIKEKFDNLKSIIK